MRSLTRVVSFFVVWGQAFLIAVSFYQTVIMVLGFRRPQPRHQPSTGGGPRFGLIVCARDEAEVVGGAVVGLRAQEYPRELFEVLVVAHNCSDETAELAARAGARVVELHTARPGKVQPMIAGLAAFDQTCDFVGVFDADSRVPPTLLATVATASEGEDCLQVETVPRDSTDWLATGYGLGRRARNLFWWRPREALGLGTTVSGTGFFIRPALLAELLANPQTLTEDLELTARLYARGGRVAYVSSTYVTVDEPHVFRASVRQRLRWVRGHFSVLRHDWPPLAARALHGDRRALDIALYMLVPTRVITRTAVTGSAILVALRLPAALPAGPVAVAFAGEWAVPALVAVRQRLVPLNRHGLQLAVRHGMLSLLWFPIGAWGLVTSRVHAWDGTPRVPVPEGDNHAVPAA